MNIIDQLYSDIATDVNYTTMTVGVVVDTNDPQQMGRIRVACPGWGEKIDSDYSAIPWAMYASPVAGITTGIEKGPDGDKTEDILSYGMWSIPKVGASVVIACIDGDPRMRIWLACLYNQHTPHTMPHGRYVNGQGPSAHDETEINPLSDNYKEAFTDQQSPEWKTRGADYSVAAVDSNNLEAAEITTPDDKDVDGIRQGYGPSQIDPDREYDTTGKNYDSTVHSWSTPGFHAFAMDDRAENSRIRIRTAAGHQLILDDTNERIYIMTATGNSWIQIDQDGTIDMYAEKSVSVRAKEDINFTSDKTIRLNGKEGIHLKSAGEIRMESGSNMHVGVGGEFHFAASTAFLTTSADIQISASGDLNLGGSNINIKGTSGTNIEASTGLNIKAGSAIQLTASAIQLNGPPAKSASKATKSSPEPAFDVTRKPDHEPYARSTSTSGPEFSPEEDDTTGRNSKWRK